MEPSAGTSWRAGSEVAAFEAVGPIQRVFSDLLPRIGNCRHPLFLAPKLPVELLDIWNNSLERRLESNVWRIILENGDLQGCGPDCTSPWLAVARNAGRAERQWQRAGSHPLTEPVGPVP